MRRITLTTEEQEALEQTFKTTTDRRLRDRCQAVLMAHRGRHCQLNGSQPDMTTIYCGYDFFEYPVLYHFTFS